MTRSLRFASLMLASAMLLGKVSAQDDPGTVFPQPAYSADQFVDFIGLNAGLFDRYLDSGPFKGAGTKYPPEVFFDLGVRHYRTGLKSEMTLTDACADVKAAYAKYGVKPLFLISPGKSGRPQEVVQLLKDYGGSEVVGELEGPNEVNNKFPPQELNLKYGGKLDEEAGAAFMVDYNRALKADPETRSIPFVSYTAIFTDYRLARPCDAFDYSNMHSYQGQGVPSSSLLSNFVSSIHLLPEAAVIKPFVPTECGYNIEEDKSNHMTGNGSARVQALGIPMILGEYFRHGFIKRAYLFALHNADGYGLLENDQETKRPSYFALQSLISILSEAKWNASTRHWDLASSTPKALLFSVEGAPRTLKSLTLQKANGDYFVLLWNELPNFDPSARRDRFNPPASVKLNFEATLDPTADLWKQDDSGAFKGKPLKIDGDSVVLDVPSSVIILHVKRTAGSGGSVIPGPEHAAGEADGKSVKLTWADPVAGVAPAGYFVARNGWCIGSIKTTSYEDRSPWIRPGLGYTYSVQAYDQDGNMSAPVAIVVQTPKKYPDYILTALGVDGGPPSAGDAVRFRAKIKNIGEGKTPADVGISVTFHVDGRVIGWGGTGGLAPGQEAEIVATGGPHPTPLWTATEGAHLLSAHIDDINRVPEEKDKVNNVRDQSLVVGAATKGEMLGSSEEAPWQVDLTKEGTEDWVHWGFKDKKAVDRKMGAGLIDNLVVTSAGYVDWTGGFSVRTSWNDGAPTLVDKGNNSGLWFNGVGGSYQFSAPADTTERVLKIYASGMNGVTCSLTATLSDSSAAPYVSKTWTGNSGLGNWAPVPGNFSVVYTIRYRAASAGQKLAVVYKLENEPDRFMGQARLGAATLSRATP